MDVCVGKYFAKNHKLLASSAFNPILFKEGYSVYEVIRIINGKVLFLKEHLERLSESVTLSKMDTEIDPALMVKTIDAVIARNKAHVGNVKLILHFTEKGHPDTYIYFIPHAYPSPGDYRQGVVTSLARSVRRDPNIKKLSFPSQNPKPAPVRSPIYEYLLVNDHEQITEGNKSNVFFITGKDIYTAPDELVLKGITRKKIIEILKYLNYNLIKLSVSINDLSNFETAFLTGTSPKVLPIQYIEEVKLHVDNPVLRRIMKEYDKMVEDGLERNLKK